MPIYKYKATNKSGQIVEGEKNATSKNEIVDELHNNGLMVVTIEEKVGINLKKLGDIQIGDMSLKDKLFYVKQLTAMLKAGLPIIQTLEILIDQSNNSSIKTKLSNVYKDVKSGLTLSASFEKYDLIFDELQISLIKAGEQSGNLIEVLQQIGDNMQKNYQINSKIRGAMIYPIIIFLTAIIVVIILVIYMIPAVESLYVDLGASEENIPAITKFLVKISDFFTNPIGLITVLLTVVGISVGFRSYYSSEVGRKSIDKIMLSAPIFGDLIVKSQVLQMVRLLFMLLKSGIPIVNALQATSESLSNIHFKNVLIYTADRVAKGSTIAVPMAVGKIIPVMVVKMVATGEETGTLDKILEDLAKFYEDEVEELTSNLTKLMEPLMLLVVGGLVAFLAIAVYLPIYSIANFV